MKFRVTFRVTKTLFECTPEIGNPTKDASKCRFSAFSARKNDTFIVLTPYYISVNTPDSQCFP